MSANKFTFIDLFAGIGGFHIGMHLNGGSCVFASEKDKFARLTYSENFSKLSPEVFEGNHFNDDITDENLDYSAIPNFDILCAGFPCQPFSHAGLKKGFDDTRGTLFFNIKEIVRSKIDRAKKDHTCKIPKVLFLENVKGFLSHNGGHTFDTVAAVLDRLGYEVRKTILNTKHFGLPQNRERIFIVAWYRDSVPVSEFRFPLGLDSNYDPLFGKEDLSSKSIPVTVGDVLFKCSELEARESKEGISYTISERLWEGHKRRRREHARKGNGFGYSSFDFDSAYTSTISARYYKDGSEILIKQNKCAGRPNRPRKLHPVEAARLQGFPIDDWYTIPVSNTQAYRQFGNSVSVPVVESIGKEIVGQLLKYAK